MDTVFGLIIFVVYIACIIAAAASVTWLVVRLTPKRGEKKPEPTG